MRIFCIFSLKRESKNASGCDIHLFILELSWIGCLTSQLTIFQSYMWRHIDVQADWKRSLTYGRAPNAIDIS